MVGAGSAAKQRKDAKKGNRGAGADLDKAYGQAREGFTPYSDIGRQGLYSLAELGGIKGYRTKEEQALSEFMMTKPELGAVDPGIADRKGFKGFMDKQERKSTVGDAFGGVTSYYGKRGRKKARIIAAAQAQAADKQKVDLAAWETKKSELEAVSNASLEKYDPTAVLRSTPGYQFRYGEGERAVLANQAARGSVLGGRGLKELTQYGQGFGAAEYQNEWDRRAQLAGIGQSAQGTLANISVGQGSQLAGLSLANAASNNDYTSSVNNAAQSGISNYLAYQQRQQQQGGRNQSSTSYGGNTYSDPGAANQFSGQDQFMRE